MPTLLTERGPVTGQVADAGDGCQASDFAGAAGKIALVDVVDGNRAYSSWFANGIPQRVQPGGADHGGPVRATDEQPGRSAPGPRRSGVWRSIRRPM